MKLGLFTVPLGERPLSEALEYAGSLGCEAVELGVGGYPGRDHCDPRRLLADSTALRELRRTVEQSELEISAFSCHGNPLHPNENVAHAHDEDFRNTVRLAAELDVATVITFAGCPGDSENSERPNWVTCAWPSDFREILDWQWSEKVAPYWEEAAVFARDHGLRVAIEPHPGFVVYNTDSFRRLREITGDVVGVNFDPSHLFWQQMDPLVCVRELGDAIFHVHAKDTWVDPQNTRRNGVLDTRDYTDEVRRSWIFRTVGYGHGLEFWRAFASELRLAGYDGALSIEHEDSLMSTDEGLRKAASLLQEALIHEPPGEAWWT